MTNYPIATASAAIFNNKSGKNDKQEILLTLRSDEVLFSGWWCLPGGRLQGGQTWESTLNAEVAEEVGLSVIKSRLVGIYSDPALHSLVDEKSGEKHCFLSACFRVEKYAGEIKLNNESTEWGWFSKDHLPERLIPGEEQKALDAFGFSGQIFVR